MQIEDSMNAFDEVKIYLPNATDPDGVSPFKTCVRMCESLFTNMTPFSKSRA